MLSKLKCASLYSPGCALLCITDSEGGSGSNAEEGRDGEALLNQISFLKGPLQSLVFNREEDNESHLSILKVIQRSSLYSK